MSSDLHNYGIIGFTSDNVGIDRRIYTGLTSTDPVLNVSYNGGRVDVYLNGIKLVGDHSEMPSGTRDYTFTQTGSGSSIQLRTGVALVSADVVECIGHVSGSGKTVNTYTPSVSAGNNTFNSSTTGMNGFTLQGSDLLNVYLNGVLLDSSDYTSDASADSVAITNLASGDVVHIQVIGALDYANFVPAGGGTFSGNVAVNGDLTVDTNTLKVDSANNAVLVGQTSGYVGDSTSASGFRVQSDGFLDVAKSGTYVMRVNRQSSDGDVISIRKDGSQVASIGSRNSSYGYFQFGDTGTAIGGTNSHKWLPIVNGVRSDNTTDIGDSSYRIKDVYLSGGVYIGGTGSANYLEDYEEGTWTPTLISRAGGGLYNSSYSDRDGAYTKIGRLVHVLGMIALQQTSGSQSGGDVMIGNLPFSIADVINYTVYEGGGSFGEFSSLNINVSSLTNQPRSDSPQGLQFRYMAASGTSGLSSFQFSHLTNSTSLRFTATYYTS